MAQPPDSTHCGARNWPGALPGKRKLNTSVRGSSGEIPVIEGKIPTPPEALT